LLNQTYQGGRWVKFCRGTCHLDAVLYILRTLLRGLILDIETWGIFGVALLMILSISSIAYLRKRESGLILWGGLLFLGIVVTTYYIASYDTVHDISWWINTGLDRMLLPGTIIVVVGGMDGLSSFDNRQDSAASFDQE